MKRLLRALELGVLLLVAIAYCKPAHAYVDMGTGSYILQVSIAAAAGAIFSMKMFWATLRDRLVKRMQRRDVTASMQRTGNHAQ